MQGDQVEGLTEFQVSSEKSTKAVLVELETDPLKNRSRINKMHSDYVGRVYWQVIISKTKMCSIKCISVFYEINVNIACYVFLKQFT